LCVLRGSLDLRSFLAWRPLIVITRSNWFAMMHVRVHPGLVVLHRKGGGFLGLLELLEAYSPLLPRSLVKLFSILRSQRKVCFRIFHQV